jgi:hypothetical protein
MPELIRGNLLLGVEDNLGRDVLHGLHGVLRKASAELCFNATLWQMTLLLENRNEAGKFRVAAILHRVAKAGSKYESGWFGRRDPVMNGTMARPEDYAQVEDIVRPMAEVLAKYCAVLTTDIARKGMVLSQSSQEIALVLNITRFGADIGKGKWRFDTPAPVFERSVEQDAERLKAEMRRLRGGR